MSSELRIPASALKVGRFELDEEASRYAIKVHRKTTGEQVLLFDPIEGIEARARIVSDRLPRLALEVEAPVAAPNCEMPVILGVAVGKADKPEQAVRDATALGAEKLVLIHAQRSVARSDSSTRAERLLRVSEQVARQCGRGRLPHLEGPVELERFLSQHAEVALKLVCAFHPSARPLLSQLSREAGYSSGQVAVLVGPEGGFSAQELSACLEAGWRAVDLGPYVLRAETAVAAVLATLRAAFLSSTPSP